MWQGLPRGTACDPIWFVANARLQCQRVGCSTVRVFALKKSGVVSGGEGEARTRICLVMSRESFSSPCHGGAS
ncbi:hypothetical protein CCHR01_09331 [Colletotrichum chrysophilum]|uniref:Uncharacterized protein n=1 Tax=Colletotrichum chrysophilum TaxID=1836956 RepID=A0AAD9AGW8_9PEZI|nr:hypothetical protein K456DRAFT_56512 [Colletotrichum gloeosporioides 23]KAK1848018.1 hypothetical protein CCHR01_09331 [Colletotrichum chrysophilum]